MAAALVRGALLFGSIIVVRKLTRVLHKAFLMDKIHTEASQREREDQSATTTSTMMNLEEVGREFERSVIDEGQGIHTEASQGEREDQSATTTSTMMNLGEVGREFERSVIDEGQGIHTEASQREREDQSATTTSTMMNLEEVGREFERSVIDEGQGIHTEASQREREDQSATTTGTMMNLEEVGREFERSVIDEGQGIHTEASQREREDQSATTTSTMMNLEEVGREFKRRVIDEGQEILKRLDDLLGQTIYLRLNQAVPTRSLKRLRAPLVVKESDVVGRDGEKKKIIELLLSADTSGNNLSVIPIVGMAGIGKTTLAQLVYKNSGVQQHFDLKVWVTISEEFDVFLITKRIYKEVTSQECETGEVFVLQSKLNEALAGKRFLFVLDDVWNENYQLWDDLKSAFKSGGHGSKIIVTTRNKKVASTMSKGVMHELKLVSDEDCWHIFAKDAFNDVDFDANSELKTSGMEIIKKCKGLPLAVKSMAGVLHSVSDLQDMRTTLQEWRKIQADDIWKLQFQQNQLSKVLPALWLSYHFLPPALKRCFAYCSIFPKDYEFEESDIEKIICLWMAEDLLTPEKGKRKEDVGEAYLKALISRSFFQQSSRRESAMVMHDLVHDLAMFISGEFCFSCGDSNDLSNLGPKSCHLSYRTASDDLTKLGAVSQSREKKPMSLRTLLALPLSSEVGGSNDQPISLRKLFLKVGGCSRVLSLSCQGQITEFHSIGNMKYLRYLDLSKTSIKELPDSICTFCNLQTLFLSNCQDLERLPTNFAALVNLHHLDIRGTSLKEMPPQMCKMKSLETLSDFVLGENGGWRIKELGEFPLLGGSLRISGLEHIVDVKDVLEANLTDKKFLSELILEWRGDSNITSTQQEIKVLEALRPHTNLKELRIRGYRGTIFPDWVGCKSFCNMVAVELLCCTNVRMLPPLGQLSFLRRLEIRNLKGVISIGNGFCGSSSTTTSTNRPFTSLQELFINQMDSWEAWSFGSEQLSQEGGVFPSLKHLEINSCPKLIVGLHCHLPSLKSISVWDCDEMVSVFVCQSRQEMDTNVFPSLESMSVGNCPRLESLLGRHSFPSKSLVLRRCKKLWENRMNLGLPSHLRSSLRHTS